MCADDYVHQADVRNTFRPDIPEGAVRVGGGGDDSTDDDR